ncbi:MAG: PilZ domain-containing protein [Bradyrhizobium sp.]
MVGTRSHPRFRVTKSAEIEHGGDKILCSVRNISITGAALMLEDLSLRVPTHFNLLITEDQLTLPCSVVWRRGFWMGVRFRDL